MEKILTIIIPSYNMEAYLAKGLSSLIVDEARMQLFEALIINDGSKDKTSEIGHQFEDKYPDTFRVIDKENGHYGSCVNRGLKEAKGTFVKIMDADDSFDTEVFAKYLEFLSSDEVSKNADMILSDWEEVDEQGNVDHTTKFGPYTNPFSISDINDNDILNWFIHILTYRTKNLIDMGYKQTEGMAHTDIEWIFYPMSKVKKAYKFDGVLYKYTMGREGQSMSYEAHAKNIATEVTMYEKMVGNYEDFMANVDVESRGFFQKRMKRVLEYIYYMYLIVFDRYHLDATPLKKLDATIKDKAPELYKVTDEYTLRIAKVNTHPIRAWRSKNKLSWLSVRTLYRFANKVNTLFHRTYRQ